MKKIVIILSMLINNTYAGNIKKIAQFQSQTLRSISDKAQVLEKAFSSDVYFNTFSYAFKNLAIEDAAYDAVEKEYDNPYSRPEYLNIVELRKNKFDSELLMVLEPFAMYSSIRNDAPDVKDFNLRVAHQVSGNPKIIVLALAHGNMFGESVGVILFDQQTNEFLIMERVYSE